MCVCLSVFCFLGGFCLYENVLPAVFAFCFQPFFNELWKEVFQMQVQVASLTDGHAESSPYGAVYLSPPLDNNWRR